MIAGGKEMGESCFLNFTRNKCYSRGGRVVDLVSGEGQQVYLSIGGLLDHLLEQAGGIFFLKGGVHPIAVRDIGTVDFLVTTNVGVGYLKDFDRVGESFDLNGGTVFSPGVFCVHRFAQGFGGRITRKSLRRSGVRRFQMSRRQGPG